MPGGGEPGGRGAAGQTLPGPPAQVS
jgi:hypothetical protein